MLIKFICTAATLSLLSGCTLTRVSHKEASPEQLSSKGWRAPDRFLEQPSFTDYAKSIRAEVDQYRIPFNAENKVEEASMASPVELKPAENCDGKPMGIAILVHGLSDTAYAMHDIANVLATACYMSRTVLLPGHGTRAGDMLNARYEHWRNTLNYLIDQASSETDNILLVGFSLGAVLVLEQAVSRPDEIDGVIGLSPAYRLSSYRKARWAPLLRPVVPWIDRGVTDDSMRYEAMPTRGGVETVKAIKQMNRQLERSGSVSMPWLVSQSLDDAVVLPLANQQLWQKHSTHPDSRLINFYSEEKPEAQAGVINLVGKDASQRGLGLSHVAIIYSPENKHYGLGGDYKNCGLTAPRDRALVKICEESSDVWYGLWNSDVDAETPMAISTFNPSFEQLADEIRSFAASVAQHSNLASR